MDFLEQANALIRDASIVDQLCAIFDNCSRDKLVNKVRDLDLMEQCLINKGEDRLFHAADQTWWKKYNGKLIRAQAPSIVFDPDTTKPVRFIFPD